jgi:hypothetical protein
MSELKEAQKNFEKSIRSFERSMVLFGEACQKLSWSIDNSAEWGLLALAFGQEPTTNQRAALLLKYNGKYEEAIVRIRKSRTMSQFMSQGPETRSAVSEGQK